jgi:lipopolysaccharide transport system permease protein
MLYSLNPMVGVVDAFRWCLAGSAPLHPGPFLVSCTVSVLLLVLGLWYFRRTEKSFADVI